MPAKSSGANGREKRDYYEILGINRSATPDDIKKAFRQLAKKYHPDLHPNDKEAEEKFKEINEANDVLSNPGKKERYDQFGFAGIDPSHGVDFSNAGEGSGFEDIFGGLGGFGDIFGDIFGGSRGGRRARQVRRRGSDIEMDLKLTFEEAVFGTKRDLQIKRRVPCDNCNGSGAEPGTKPEKCPTCNGRGQVARTQRTPFGMMQQITTCNACDGRGEIIKKKCSKCKGTRVITNIDTIHIPISPGFPDEGVVVPIEGKGNMEESGSTPGNLYLSVTVGTNPIFTRDGKHLVRDFAVDYLQLLLGDEVSVATLEGHQVNVKIPPGTKHGVMLRVENHGVPIFRDKKGNRGDLFLNVVCDVPKLKDLSRDERETYEMLAEKRLEKIHELLTTQEQQIQSQQEQKQPQESDE
ncbi:MAG TPA: molecular chaperone DnaJ [Candidatus Lokiarchaeia archaeon]|nr:molecular chaperone DnaJ [Candidatus Lokiarchaeia archaeon]